MLQRAYALLQIKSVDEEQRIIYGVATTPTPDRMGDIVEPRGAEFRLPIPLLWQHDASQPIGEVFKATVTDAGIEVQARVAKIDEPGTLKDRLDEAWQSIKAQLVRGLSIGFSDLESSYIKETGAFHFLRWLWLELSAVTIPANAEASIQSIKSYDTGRAASGRKSVVIAATKQPGDSGRSRVVQTRTSTAMKKSYADQIADLRLTREAKGARMTEIQTKVADEGRTKDAAERQEFDDLDVEIKAIDDEIADLEKLERVAKSAAVEVKGADQTHAAAARAGILVKEPELPKGIAFARYVSCKMASFIEMQKGNFVMPLDLAKQRYPSHTALHAAFQKTAVDANTAIASHALDDLVPYQVLASDFIEYLRPKTIIDRLQGLRRVPFNIRVGGFSAGSTGYWKGEGKPITPSNPTSENVTLTWATVAGMTVLTQELMRFSTPSAEQALRDDLAGAVIARMDIDFVDPTKAAVANTSPASITYGVVATAPSGTAATNVRHDLATMLQAIAQTLQTVAGVALIMSDTMATAISMMVNTLGQPDFPQMTPSGGTINGIPVLVSEHLTSVGSPSTQTIVLCKPSEIFLADDGQVTVDASMEASVEMSDAPTQDGTAGTGASLLSLWQNGLIGIRVQRQINWKLRRTHVQYISPAAYAVPTS